MPVMDLSAYRALWRTLGVPSLLFGSLLARLPTVAIMIPMSFLAKDASGGFGWAGVVAGAYSIGTAFGAPWWARTADRRGPARVLVLTGFAWSIGLAALGATPDDWYGAMPVVSFLAGLFLPPVSSTTRAAWPRMMSGRRLRAVYALDATSVEVLFVIGPMLGALMVTFASPRAGMFTAAGIAAAGVWWYAEHVPDSASREDRETPLTTRQLLWHRHRLAILGSFGLAVGAFSAISLAIAAFADDHGNRMIAGWLEMAWAAGSLLGGLVVGAMAGNRPSFAWRRMTLVCAGMAVAAFATWSPLATGLALFLSGTTLAPTVGALYERLGALTPDSVRTEMFGWMNAGAMLGGAAGSAVAGVVVEAFGVPYALGAAALMSMAAAGLLFGVPPHLPEPRADEVPAEALIAHG